MIERIGSTYQSLQGLQATRSFNQVSGSGSVFRQALAQEMDESPQGNPTQMPQEDLGNFEAPVTQFAPQKSAQPQSLGQGVSSAYNHLMPLIQDVQNVAEASGFIGVSSEDVLRAYQSGQSLLANYSV